MAEAVLKVNRIFWEKQDWRGVALIALCVVLRGKAVAALSDLSRQRLSTFVTIRNDEFSKAIISYAAAVLMLSPMDLVFNELVSRLRAYWSHKLTVALATKMVSLSVSLLQLNNKSL